MGEVRNRREGNLYWTPASGSGSAWATASGAAKNLLGYVRNFQWTSASTVQVISDRGLPSHNKEVSKEPISLSFDVAWANTGNLPVAVSGSGATVPMLHMEFKMTAPEAGAAFYYQFHGIPVNSVQFQEGDQENTVSYNLNALAMLGPTASGYCG